MTTTPSSQIADGLSARRERNREAVIDALIEMLMAGEDEPSVDDIANRAGVSYRSVYRYFDDRTDMLTAAARRSMAWVGPLLAEASGPYKADDPLDHRIDSVVDARAEVYVQIADILRTALMRSHEAPYIAEEMHKARELLREQINVRFANELDRFDVRERELRLTSIDQTLQFQSLDYVMHERGHTREELERYLRGQIRLALTVPAADLERGPAPT